MLTIVVPMSGKGSRFAQAGYTRPKPFLICPSGKPMIREVMANLRPLEPHRFIFIARREHEEYLKYFLLGDDDKVIYVDEVTEGAACSVLLAREFINNYDPLIIANSDQLVVWNDTNKLVEHNMCYYRESNSMQDFINYARGRNVNGSIAVFNDTNPKWSFAKVDDDGFVTEVAEKKPISNLATVGIYYYRHGADFCVYADQMIRKNIRVNNEFYVCPVFNEMIKDFGHINVYKVARMIGLGTPEDFERFVCE